MTITFTTVRRGGARVGGGGGGGFGGGGGGGGGGVVGGFVGGCWGWGGLVGGYATEREGKGEMTIPNPRPKKTIRSLESLAFREKDVKAASLERNSGIPE